MTLLISLILNQGVTGNTGKVETTRKYDSMPESAAILGKYLLVGGFFQFSDLALHCGIVLC